MTPKQQEAYNTLMKAYNTLVDEHQVVKQLLDRVAGDKPVSRRTMGQLNYRARKSDAAIAGVHEAFKANGHA